jgi:hypothetical protein
VKNSFGEEITSVLVALDNPGGKLEANAPVSEPKIAANAEMLAGSNLIFEVAGSRASLPVVNTREP